MTKDPFTVGPGDLGLDVLREMRARGFRHVPVVREGKLAGVVSERDLLRVLPHLVGDIEREGGEKSLNVSIRSVMHRDVQTCSPSDPVDAVARQMLAKRMGCMAVVDRGQLVGMVTTTDLLRGFTDHLLVDAASAMTFVWTKGKLSSTPDIAALAVAAGVHVVAYFATETTTGALALMVRVLGSDEQEARFVEECIGAGLLLMANRKAA